MTLMKRELFYAGPSKTVGTRCFTGLALHKPITMQISDAPEKRDYRRLSACIAIKA